MKHHILSIGISQYKEPGANLDFAAKDAKEFYQLFKQNISELGYNKLIVDNEATLSQIQSALGRELQSEVKSEDVLFVFYSGHGATDDSDGDGSLSHYIVPYDATRDIASTAVSVSYLKESLDKIDCKAKFIFIDSCFSGSANSKHFPQAKVKAISGKPVKTIIDTVSGQGEFVITASKDDEESIEDPEYKNGLFTYFLLKELQKDNGRTDIPIETVFNPVSIGVTKRAKEKYNHIQTPTMGGHIEGGLYIPRLVKPLVYKPEFIDIPTTQTNKVDTVPIANLSLSDKQLTKEVNEQVNYVLGLVNLPPVLQNIHFERLCKNIFSKLSEDWNTIFNSVGGDASKIPNAVAELEAKSVQFILLGNVTALCGTSSLMAIYSHYVGELYKLREGRAGFVALAEATDVIVVLIIYTIGICTLLTDRLNLWGEMLKAVFYLTNDDEPSQLLKLTHIHYADALGGNAIKLNDHARAIIGSYEWLEPLCPRYKPDKLINYYLQINLLLCVMLYGEDDLYTDFGRFERSRITYLLRRISQDSEFKGDIAALCRVQANQIRPRIENAFSSFVTDWHARNGGWWRSVENPNEYLYTQAEIKAQEAKKQ